VYREIQSIRSRITDRIIVIAVVFLTPAFIASITRWVEVGWLNIYIVHTFLYALVIGILIFRDKISTKLKVFCLILLFTVLGIAALWYLGFSGLHYFVIVAIAIASVLSERKTAYWLIGIIATIYMGIGILYMLHIHNAKVELNEFSHSILQWSTIILSLIAFAAIFIDGFGEMYNTLVSSLYDKELAQRTLKQQNNDLENAKKQLAETVKQLNAINLKLQLSEEKYRTLISFSPDIVYRYSTKGGGLFFSERTQDILGYLPEEFVNGSWLWYSLIDADDLQLLKSNLKRAKLNEKNVQVYKVKTQSGKSIWVKDTFFIIKHNIDEIVVQGHLADVTAQKNMERELNDSEERWHFSVDGSELGLWDWNIVSKKVFYSRQWKEMLGYNEEDIEDGYTEWESRVHPEDLPMVLKELNKYFKGESDTYSCEHRMRCKDGSYKWMLNRGKILNYTEDGSPLRMIGTHSDITEQKQAEMELRRTNTTKDKFFSIIAHDLKSPFNSIMGLSEILHENFDDLDEKTRKKFVTGIHEGVRRTYDLLEDLLLWSRAQRDTIDFFPANLGLAQAVDEMVSVLKIAAENKSIHIHTHIPEGTNVFADKFMLLSVLRNLISNAIKFTPKNGDIRIGVNMIEYDGKRFTKISVKDTGVGISAEDHVTIFDIGQNISKSGTENETGTGMGLPICYEFVTKHGGNMWFESEPGKGATFYFTLPQAD